jgi:hypothetical protein
MKKGKGRTQSPETRAKMSAAHKGRPGRPLSPETRAKIAAAKKGYGNDSRQTGPLPSRLLHISPMGQFAFYVGTRTQRLMQRRARHL